MILYIIELVAILILSLFLVLFYAHASTPIYVRVLVVISLFFSLICFMILPTDIYETSQESTISNQIHLVWNIIYGVNFFLCWLILPFVQQFEDSGDFTFKGRIKDSLKINGILFGGLGLGGLLLMLYLIIAGKFTITQLPALIPTLVNIFGLVFVSIILGFGLISFPKQCWRNSDYKKRVKRCHIMAQKLKNQQQLTKEVVFEIKKIIEERQVRHTELTDGNEATILYYINDHMQFEHFRSYSDPNEKLPNKQNCDLQTIVKKKIVQYDACQNQLDELVDELKMVTQDFSKNNYSIKKVFFLILFILTTLISILIFWAQLSTFITVFNTINVFRLIDWSSPAAYFLNLILITYVAYIATHTVFRIKVFHKFSLHKKNSSSASLCFTCINLARISFPLCYNYQQITNMPKSIFLDFFGVINIDDKYGFIFPIIMLVFAFFNLFDIYDKVIGYLGYESFAFDEEQEQQKTEEGRTILLQKFKRRNTEMNRMQMIEFL